MANYFTSDHFKLLNKWKGQKRDESNPEQNRAYEELKQAYELVAAWADKLRERCFPDGRVEVRKRPTNQANNFAGYLWARIYPSPDAPKELAYTVDIAAGTGFTVKIDTADLDDTGATRQAYLSLRGAPGTPGFVADLAAEDGLGMSLDELTEWSANAIGDFVPSYEQLCDELDLAPQAIGFVHQAPMGFPNGAHGVTLNPAPPKRQGHCMDVWVVSQLRQRETGRTPSRDEVAGDPRLAKSNANNVEQEFYRWRRWWNEGRSPAADADHRPDGVTQARGPERRAEGPAPVNRILYGPPGTGKTHRTIDEAVKLLDPDFEAAAGEDPRTILKARFDELVREKRIRFVTFHQSFSYEDFVEGIRAKPADGGPKFDIEHGIFRQICRAAAGSAKVAEEVGVRDGARIWKLSIDGTGPSQTRDYCLAHGEARIGWAHVGDLRDGHLTETPDFIALGSNDRNTLLTFACETEPGDVVLCIGSDTTVQAIGVIQGEYDHQPETPLGVRSDYANILPVNWLATGLSLDIRPINDGRRFTQKTIYEIDRFGWPKLSDFLGANAVVLEGSTKGEHLRELPHVLIIDEINRGNISRIFGELITLIEPSKRKGMPEALEVVLPYSKDPFSVPANLHLIGTMNTADRSLAGLDLALRRRFEFVEMLPEPELLTKVVVAGIPIKALLEKINSRIEALLGRDYTIGHAYFMGLNSESPIGELADVFQRKVMPLLQEYFFEDWEKIAWVLNDHRKEDASLQFVRKKGRNPDLFGPDVDQPRATHDWYVDPDVFTNEAAYRAIIEAPVAAALALASDAAEAAAPVAE